MATLPHSWRRIPSVVYPEEWKPLHHKAIPPDILKRYTSAQYYLNSNAETYDGVFMQCRKVLEMTCDEKLGDNSLKLYKKIEKLASDGLITPLLREWAHNIREIGNDGAHEDTDPTKEEAQEVINFAETFLEYIYVLPDRIMEIRQAREGGDDTGSEEE